MKIAVIADDHVYVLDGGHLYNYYFDMWGNMEDLTSFTHQCVDRSVVLDWWNEPELAKLYDSITVPIEDYPDHEFWSVLYEHAIDHDTSGARRAAILRILNDLLTDLEKLDDNKTVRNIRLLLASEYDQQ